jgi:16S rRNA processing protein RimM
VEKQLAKLKSIDTLFVQLKTGSLPYAVISLRKAKDNAYFIKFEEITDRNEAEKIIGKDVFAEKNMFRKKETAEGFSFILGYMITDTIEGELGEVDDVLQMPAGDVARVVFQNKEVLLPLNDETVVEINKRQKKIQVTMPDGLIKMYLSL